jgi:hypothetical protein
MSVLDLTSEVKPAFGRKITYKSAYHYWYALLTDKAISLFDWTGLPFPQRELEIRAQMHPQGYIGVVKYESEILVANGSGVGVTNYPDEWITYVWANALHSSINNIGRDCAILRNNSLLISTGMMVDHYSRLLAHATLSLQAALINTRATGYSTAKNDQTAKRIKKFYEALEEGRTEAILIEDDLNSIEGSKPVEFISDHLSGRGDTILDIWQVLQNILKDFYTAIGISKPTDKRERLITDEIAQEQPLFKFNVEDMLDCRKRFAEEINQIFGLSVSVDVAESLKEAQGGAAAPREDRREADGDAATRMDD